MWNTLDRVKALAPAGAPEMPFHRALGDTGTVWMGQYWLRENENNIVILLFKRGDVSERGWMIWKRRLTFFQMGNIFVNKVSGRLRRRSCFCTRGFFLPKQTNMTKLPNSQ